MNRFAVSQRVRRERPCPVCGKPDWCAFSSDGRFIHCQRSEEWNGKRAIRQTAGGWLHPVDDRAPRRARLLPPPPTPVQPTLPRAVLDAVYRRLARVCGLDDFARHDLVSSRRFLEALDSDALYFSLPGAGSGTPKSARR